MNNPLFTSSDLPIVIPGCCYSQSHQLLVLTSYIPTNLHHNSILRLSRMPRTKLTQPVTSVATQITLLMPEPYGCPSVFSF